LIRAGVTGIAAHVGEPFLDATIRPEILFPAYVSGFNLIEAYYLAMPYLSWQTVVIGDPLCAPFPRTAPPQTSLEPPADQISELPAFYAARRVREIQSEMRGVQPAVARLLLRAEGRRAKGDQAGHRQTLEQVVAIDAQLVSAHLALATVYDQAGEHDKAIERYRHVLTIEPNQVGALNNLAYALAVHRGTPGEALPLAQRAFTASNEAPLVADTLGWVFHLSGDRMQALRYTQMAAAGAPRIGEVRYHYAAALANAGDPARAAKELAAALELDPALKTRRDVQALHKTLGGASR
jgi:Tfp pilus assembly protein PilF